MPVTLLAPVVTGRIARRIDVALPVVESPAFRIAKLAQVSVDAVFGGKYPPAGTCRRCGHPPVGDGSTCPGNIPSDPVDNRS